MSKREPRWGGGEHPGLDMGFGTVEANPRAAVAHFPGPPASLTPSLLPQFTVTFDNDGFKVKLSDGHQLTFPNRMGHSHLSYLSIQGGLSITSFKID